MLLEPHATLAQGWRALSRARRRSLALMSTRARAAWLGALVLLCSGWSLLPDVNDVLEDWAGQLAGVTLSLLTGAFSGQLGSISNTEWNLATAMTGKFGMVMGVVAVGLCAVQVIAGLVAGDLARVATAAVWAMLAWPATGAAVWAIIKLTGAVDTLAVGILSSSGSAEAIALVFTGLLAASGSNPLMLLIWAVAMWLPSLVLSLVMAFRNYSLLLLVGFAPAAIMSQGWRALRPIAAKWAQAVVALILTKVFAAGILVLSMDLIVQGQDLGALITGIVGLCLACLAPAASMAVMSWAGGQITDAAASRLTSTARSATAPVRNFASNQTNRLLDKAANSVRESWKSRSTNAPKTANNPAEGGNSPSSPAPNTKGAPQAPAPSGGATTPAGAGASTGAGAATVAGAGSATGAGSAAGGSAAAGAGAGAAAGPVGAVAGAGLAAAKSGADKVKSLVTSAAQQGMTPPASGGGASTGDGAQSSPAGTGGGASGDRLRSAVAAMSSTNDHLLTTPGASTPGGPGGATGASGRSPDASTSHIGVNPRGPRGGRAGGAEASGTSAGAPSGAGSSSTGSAPTGSSSTVRTAAPAVPRRSGPAQSSGGGNAGPSLFGGGR